MVTNQVGAGLRQGYCLTSAQEVLPVSDVTSPQRKPTMTRFALFRRPSAFVPVAMSLAALSTVVVYVVRFGVARQPDEGTAAHLWQLLMVGQVPVIALFAVRWLPEAPRQALLVLALQVCAALAAAAPVFILGF